MRDTVKEIDYSGNENGILRDAEKQIRINGNMFTEVFWNDICCASEREVSMADILKQRKQEEYQEYVKQVTPTHNLFLNMAKAFVMGGAICVVGQFILNRCSGMGMDKETAGSWCSLILVLLSVILTGCNIYQKLAKFGGAGTLVPITGFANSVAAPAIEYKKEGQVFGIGCKIFTIAGPVILYGLVTSWVLGLVYWIGMKKGVV